MASLQYLVICDNVPETMQTINSESGLSSSRDIDLVVRKVETKNNKIATIKYWVMDKSLVDAPIAQSTIFIMRSLFELIQESTLGLIIRVLHRQRCYHVSESNILVYSLIIGCVHEYHAHVIQIMSMHLAQTV